MGVNIDSSNIRDLATDYIAVPNRATRRVAEVVGDEAKRGNRIAQTFARESAGEHGKHYHRAFEAERLALMAWAYGPNAAMRQGGMSFEWGSRNQPPHLDLNRSADIIGPTLASKIGDAIQDVVHGE